MLIILLFSELKHYLLSLTPIIRVDVIEPLLNKLDYQNKEAHDEDYPN